ncbi:hypothetical protein B0H14DRAFT_2568139 [Mycena olivaceomarginata]|nr:hypothetical protein B0H14DRAFT_2568139 [Mycena olivaceomarginata]
MPLVTLSVAYSSFGDIKETIGLAYRIYEILHSSGVGASSSEIQKTIQDLKSFYNDMATLMTHLGAKSSTNAQQIVDRISAELGSCHVLLQKLYAGLSTMGVLARIWLALSEDKALTAGEPRWGSIAMRFMGFCSH